MPVRLTFAAASEEVFALSAAEALRLQAHTIAPEHLLLGLLRQGNSLLALAGQFGADVPTLQETTEYLALGLYAEEEPSLEPPRFKVEVSRLLAMAGIEAALLEENSIKPEHILLALARSNSPAALACAQCGLRYAELRAMSRQTEQFFALQAFATYRE